MISFSHMVETDDDPTPLCCLNSEIVRSSRVSQDKKRKVLERTYRQCHYSSSSSVERKRQAGLLLRERLRQ